jgi:hypothetical protein
MRINGDSTTTTTLTGPGGVQHRAAAVDPQKQDRDGSRRGHKREGGMTQSPTQEKHMKRKTLLRQSAGVFTLCVALVAGLPATAQSEADCAARADRAAKDSSGPLGGAVAGGVGGAVFGAIVSDKSRKGAKRGGALGAVVGGASGAHSKNQVYKQVYDACMAGR